MESNKCFPYLLILILFEFGENSKNISFSNFT